MHAKVEILRSVAVFMGVLVRRMKDADSGGRVSAPFCGQLVFTWDFKEKLRLKIPDKSRMETLSGQKFCSKSTIESLSSA